MLLPERRNLKWTLMSTGRCPKLLALQVIHSLSQSLATQPACRRRVWQGTIPFEEGSDLHRMSVELLFLRLSVILIVCQSESPERV